MSKQSLTAITGTVTVAVRANRTLRIVLLAVLIIAFALAAIFLLPRSGSLHLVSGPASSWV